MDQTAPKPLPPPSSETEEDSQTKRHADRLTKALLQANALKLRKISWRKSPRTEGYKSNRKAEDKDDARRHPDMFDDLAMDVGRTFFKKCMTEPDFLAEMLEHGIGNFQKDPRFKRWVKDALAEQHEQAFRLLPRYTCQIDELFLRIAALRSDGRLFPLVRKFRTKRETSYLKQLLADDVRKLEPVSAWSGEEEWEKDSSQTLRLTEGREGAGRESLERLVKSGFIVEALCEEDQRLIWSRDEYQRPQTLELTEKGRRYLSQVDHNDLCDPVSESEDDGDDGPSPGVQVASDEDDAEDRLDGSRYREMWLRLSDAMEKKLADPTLTGSKRKSYLKAYAFALRFRPSPNVRRPMTLQQVSERLDVPVPTLGRWEKEGRDEDLLAELWKFLTDLEDSNHRRGGARPHDPTE